MMQNSASIAFMFEICWGETEKSKNFLLLKDKTKTKGGK